MAKKNFPLVIQNAITRLDSLLDKAHVRWGRSKTIRAMRPERVNAMILILRTMLQMSVLQFDGAFCRIMKDGKARFVTVSELAVESGVPLRTTWRVLRDLKDLNLLNTQKQHRFKCAEGLKVAPCLRCFTRMFWEMLGLWSLFVEGVKYASKHGRLIIVAVVKLVASNTLENRNLAFLTAQNCYKGKRPKKCYGGGGQTKEVCNLCHKFVQCFDSIKSV